MVNKKYLLFLPVFVLTITGCYNPNIPEELLHFCNNFSLSNAIKTHQKGTLEYFQEVFDKGISIGTYAVDYTYDISDENNYSAHLIETYTGDHIIDNIIKNEVIISKKGINENGKTIYQRIETQTLENGSIVIPDEGDGESNSGSDLSSDYVYSKLILFFGEENQGMITNGLYYGDMLNYMLNTNYMMMSINKDNNLEYVMPKTHIQQDNTYIEYDMLIDEYGMLLDYHNDMSNAPNSVQQRRFTTSIKVNYNEQK